MLFFNIKEKIKDYSVCTRQHDKQPLKDVVLQSCLQINNMTVSASGKKFKINGKCSKFLSQSHSVQNILKINFHFDIFI